MAELSPSSQAWLHFACALQHFGKAAAAVWQIRVATLRLVPLLLLLALLCHLVGCDDKAQPRPVVVPTPPSETQQLSRVSAAVSQARADNAQNPEGLPKQAVDLQLSVAQAGLPVAAAVDKTEAKDTSALVFAGKLEAALQRAVKAEQGLVTLRGQVEKERQEGTARLNEVIADAERKVREAEERARREAYVRVVSIFAIIGGAITIIGIICAVSGWHRIGVVGIPAGILIGGSGLLWGQVWFTITVGAGVLLCAIGGGIFWAVRAFESRSSSAGAPPIPPTK
jgi:hypothetical protein